ncbi:hypothetical protein [Chitinivorax sp. B]|uniref:hypothetical protein n=1 Tax=Chitinivorax sp. B TaxID=2502235 RepID=UPI0010F7CE07|nr:hypothetical protein [Chitinivorax sp. B]
MQKENKTIYFYAAIFFLSGVSGLIYESIWSRYLKLFLGHAAYAQALVLVVFMGGMSIGAWMVAKRVNSLKNPLRGYAVVEFVIGLFAMTFNDLYHFVTELLFSTWLPVFSNTTFSYALVWSLATLLILPPAILLGATFPLMSNGVMRLKTVNIGRAVATLYFTNSLGGAIGVLFNSFFLIAWVGLPGAMLTAGLVNILIAMLVWLSAKPAVENRLPHEVVDQLLPVKSHYILIIAALTGCASFMYEIGWIRMLSMVLGSSTHSFELMLSAFIIGLALGSWWVKSRIDHIEQPMRFLAITQIAMGIAAILTLWGYSRAGSNFTPCLIK